MRITFFLIYIFLTNSLLAQCWVNTFGNSQTMDISSAVIETFNSDLIITGSGFYNVINTDKNGVVKWTKLFPDTSGYSSIQSVVETDNGEFTFCGYIDFITCLIHTDNKGNIIWKTTFDTTMGYGPVYCYLLKTNDKGYLICHPQQLSDTLYITRLYKTDRNGKLQWSKILDNWITTSINKTIDNNYLLTQWKSVSNINESRLRKVDTLGNNIWTKQLAQGDIVSSALNLNNNQIMSLGEINSVAYMRKLDKCGNIIWTKNISIPEYCVDYGRLKRTIGGDFVLTETTIPNFSSGGDSTHCYIIIADSSANVICKEKISFREVIFQNDMILTDDNKIVVTGYTYHNFIPEKLWDIFLLKADKICSCQYVDNPDTINNIPTPPTPLQPKISNYFYVNLYPNPTDFALTVNISTNNDIEGIQLFIYDLYGRKIIQMPVTNKNFNLNTSILAGGIYSYEFRNLKSRHRFGKGQFVVEH